MQAVNYSHARNNLKSLIDLACDDNEEIIITTKNDKSVVMLSLDTYNRTHAEVKRNVQKAIAQIEQGDYAEIDEAFQRAKSAYRN
jgi:PHD/YefM family antitoxin component YafN of YafNO toxin-antitoxin module